ncbi:hypothetical protein CCYA_CCYA07G2064 [Cyanidiococcus yangmingshanensis]|nr:hypothetical protein CCYA_CCYA07G2064 [Cyanidiococcus yangmingshanensis]
MISWPQHSSPRNAVEEKLGFLTPAGTSWGLFSSGTRTYRYERNANVCREGKSGRQRGNGGQFGRCRIIMMPVGVPKVAFRVPGGTQAEWVDIYNRMYRERIIFLGSELDDELANQIIAVMLYLDSEDNTKPIYLYINSPGGSVVAGLAVYDTMRHIKSEVVTINVGLAASMSSFLLAAGEKGKRFALPHSRVMIHQPLGGAQGQASDLKVEAEQILRIRDALTHEYSKMTGKPYEKLIRDMSRDNFMSAHEALEYGLIDRVIEGKAV